MENQEKIELGQKIMDKLVSEQRFKTTDVSQDQDEGKEVFRKFATDIWLGFYCSDEGVFSFGWRVFFDSIEGSTRGILKQVLETSVFNKDFSKTQVEDPWIWREYEGDYSKPFDEIYRFFVEKFNLLEELANNNFA
ncbi:MAG: hypothetical protein LBD20_06760 [Spirochaetaceae bacterium]|jgi:hypothetical protein|nr:hypothetical protein [Spirochaetaceae bacterium]